MGPDTTSNGLCTLSGQHALVRTGEGEIVLHIERRSTVTSSHIWCFCSPLLYFHARRARSIGASEHLGEGEKAPPLRCA